MGKDEIESFSDIERSYEEARRLFLRGDYQRALEKWKSIYAITFSFRDVAQIVEDSYTMSESEWMAKSSPRFQ